MSGLLETEWDRRTMLRSMLAGVLLLGPQAIRPSRAAAASMEGRLLLQHAQTGERLGVTYRNDRGEYDEGALEVLHHFMRCQHSGKVANMDLRVLDILSALQAKCGPRKELVVLSAYRSPEYHAYLIKHNKRAARNSYHVSGQAIDFHIHGVPLRSLRMAALRLGQGGVGYYPKRHFLHIDSGPVRRW